MDDNKAWQASWIWAEQTATLADRHELVYFRRKFHVSEQACSLKIDVSADSRYRLFINGKSVVIGPCKGDGQTHYYETIDLSGELQLGDNVLAVKVMHFTKSEPYQYGMGPVSVWRANAGAFLLQGDLRTVKGELVESLDTDSQWKCLRDEAISFGHGDFTFFVGGVEKVNGARLPHDWENISYNDQTWTNSVIICSTSDVLTGQLTPWQLAPRPIPPMYERNKDFKRIVRGSIDINNIKMDVPIHLQPNYKFFMELDAGELTTGYLQLILSGGKQSLIRILCSECYEPNVESVELRNKGVRDKVEGNVLLGEYDQYQVAGIGQLEGQKETYEPFWFRTFRYVRLEIEVGEEPIILHNISYRETGYPLEVIGNFISSDENYQRLWDISVNTLKRCMHETYEDCPYYEQLQYSMDSSLQMLFTYNISGDDRLARRTMYDFHSSMLPSGMLQSRYPSVYPQVIPGFSFYWIFMIYDHFMYYGDKALVIRYRSTIDAVLGWFDRNLTTEGILGSCPKSYWSYVDWVEEWKETLGAPTASLSGPITVYSLMYATALNNAAELNEWTDRKDIAKEYRDRAQKVNAAVRNQCWSTKKELFQDGPSVDLYSQHVQVWAVLSGEVIGTEAQLLMKKTLSDPSLAKVSYAMSFYLFRALSKAGLYHETFKLWTTWINLLSLNLTSWLEDPVGHRSDCHAWGAIPLYEFPAEILGVKPGEPGFKRIVVSPNPGNLTWAKGTVITHLGPVKVEWKINSDQKMVINVEGPKDVPIDIRLPEGILQSIC